MDNSYQTTESQTADGFESNDLQMPTDDQFFLMYLIMGIFFGPGVKDCPQKSALQRAAENLPLYTSDKLIGTQMRTVEVERIYYHVLRKAEQSVLVKLPILHRFFQGDLHTPGEQRSTTMHPQFPDLFPTHLHPHSRSLSGYKVIENIVFINSPETNYLNPKDIQRFKRLTGLESFVLNRDAARMHTSATGGGVYNLNLQENESNGDYGASATKACRNTSRIGDPFHEVHAVTPISSMSHNGTPMRFSFVGQPHAEPGTRPLKEFGPAMIYLPSHPNMNEWENIVAATRSGFALTGSAAQGQVGPVIGLMDIGECDDSYLFRVSLPGVKRDGREFSCEVEPDGRVLIKGVTITGEKRVYRHSQMFEMKTQNLSPPGNFSISFQLPGPVNPLQFTGNFGTDGVLEGVVMKEKQKK